MLKISDHFAMKRKNSYSLEWIEIILFGLIKYCLIFEPNKNEIGHVLVIIGQLVIYKYSIFDVYTFW